VALYTRRQLWLLLLLSGAAGAGLVIDHWRRARPELAAQLETLDRGARPVTAPPSSPPPTRHPCPARLAEPIDVNRATEPELARVPGLGPALAARIVAARPFGDLDELRRVKGVRRTTLERVRRHLIAGPP
jgi:DNA uptake protein ComE-like DNA-binding protein